MNSLISNCVQSFCKLRDYRFHTLVGKYKFVIKLREREKVRKLCVDISDSSDGQKTLWRVTGLEQYFKCILILLVSKLLLLFFYNFRQRKSKIQSINEKLSHRTIVFDFDYSIKFSLDLYQFRNNIRNYKEIIHINCGERKDVSNLEIERWVWIHADSVDENETRQRS